MAKDKKDREHETVTPKDVGAMPPAVLEPPPAASLPVVAGSDDSEVTAAFKGALTQPQQMAMPIINTISINHPERQFQRDGELIPVIYGYPIYTYQLRGYWEKMYTPGSKELPVCYSNDMKYPDEASEKKQADSCAKCKKAQFGSHPLGKGQACKTTTLLFLADMSNKDTPISVLILPPSSIKSLMGSGGRFPKPGYLQIVRNSKDPTLDDARKALAGCAAGSQAHKVWSEVVRRKEEHVAKNGGTGGGSKVQVPQVAFTEWRLVEPHEKSIHALLEPHFVSMCPSKEEAVALAKLIDDNLDAMNAFRGDAANVIYGDEE